MLLPPKSFMFTKHYQRHNLTTNTRHPSSNMLFSVVIPLIYAVTVAAAPVAQTQPDRPILSRDDATFQDFGQAASSGSTGISPIIQETGVSPSGGGTQEVGQIPSQSTGGQDSAPISNGQDSAPISNGQDSAPISGGQDSAPVSNGQDSAPVSNGQDSAPISGGQQDVGPAPGGGQDFGPVPGNDIGFFRARQDSPPPPSTSGSVDNGSPDPGPGSAPPPPTPSSTSGSGPGSNSTSSSGSGDNGSPELPIPETGAVL